MIEFCLFSDDLYEALVKAYQECFLMSNELFYNSYSIFIANANNPEAHINYVTPYLLRNEIQPKTIDNTFKEKFNNIEYLLGVDLPILLTKLNNLKTVMVIAEDPLRNPGDELIAISKQHVLLSTPFATHLDSCRKALKEYWDFHLALLNEGNNVYITDINKIWLKGDSKSNKEAIPSDLLTNFRKTLQSEIEIIKPDMIIVYGKKAGASLKAINIQFDGKVVEFPHPSKSANGTWKKLFNLIYPGEDKKCTSANKTSYMLDQVVA